MIAKLNSSLLLVLLFLLFLAFNSAMLPAVFGYADELAMVVAFASLVVKVFWGKLDKFTIILLFYLAYSLVNSALSKFQPDLLYAFLQSVIHIKLFLISYAAVILYVSVRCARIVKFIFAAFFLLFLVGMIGNFTLGERWNYLMTSDPVQYRYGFVRPVGYFGHYAPNAYFFSLFVVTFFMMQSRGALRSSFQVLKFFAVVIVDFLAAFPLTVRKGLLIVPPYGLYILSILSPLAKVLFFVSSVVLSLVAIYSISDSQIFKDSISNISNLFSGDHSYVRGLLVFHAVSLFQEFFPLGVGNGLYGTYFSASNSAVYDYVGINLELFSVDGVLVGIYDSGLASLVAEAGFFGLLFVALMVRQFFLFNKKHLDFESYKVFKVITYFAILLSLTEPVWQNGFFTAFYVICLVYIYSRQRDFCCGDKQ